MSDTAAAFEVLWADCTANNRLVPIPPQWNQLYGLLKNTRQSHRRLGAAAAADPCRVAPPVPIEKQLRFK